MASWVADEDGAFVVEAGIDHVYEFIFIFGLHEDGAWDGAEVGDIEESVVGGAVVCGEAGSVHAEEDIEVL